MPIVDKEDIVGYFNTNQDVICVDCMTVSDWDNLNPEKILLRHEVENDDDRIYFCDECDQRI